MTDQAYDPFATGAEEAEMAAYLSGGNVAAIFPEVGQEWGGTITARRMQQQTDKDTRESLWMYNGKVTKDSLVPGYIKQNPKNQARQMILDLQCKPTGFSWKTNKYIRYELPDDDGMRTLYVKGMMKQAIAEAVRAKLGHPVPEIGGYLRVRRGPDRVANTNNLQYTYVADYTPAAQNAAGTIPGAAPNAQAAGQSPWDAQPATPAQPQYSQPAYSAPAYAAPAPQAPAPSDDPWA
jgi:hypothetical protein